MKFMEKIHKQLQEKALDKAILKTIGDIGEYFIDEGELKILVKDYKLQKFNNLNFVFPSWKEIREKALNYYYGFDIKNVEKVKYYFSYLELENDLIISAKDSDLYFGNNNFTDIKILDADSVTIYGDPIEDGGISINAKNIEIIKFNGHINGNINLTCSCLGFNDITILFANNINLDSDMIEFNKVYLFSYNMNLKSNLIVTEKSKLSAVKKINISDTNLDEIKEVEAPVIIYNGQDISYSEGIVIPKLKRNLIDVLYKVKNKVNRDLNNELAIETEKLKQELNNKTITKVLKK